MTMQTKEKTAVIFGTGRPFSISQLNQQQQLPAEHIPAGTRASRGRWRGTHRCAADCGWRAAGHSRGSSSAPTRTGTCTPPSRCVHRLPRCWRTSGKPGVETAGLKSTLFQHFSVKTDISRLRILSLCTWQDSEPICSGKSGSLESTVSNLQNKITPSKFLIVCMLITLGPVIRKLFTDLKQRK